MNLHQTYLLAVLINIVIPPERLFGYSFQRNVNSYDSMLSHILQSRKRTSCFSIPNEGGHEFVSTMPPPLPEKLRNTYYLLRHGQSTANVAGIISSSRSLMNSDEHGLTPQGIEQGKASAQALINLIKENSVTDNEEVEVVFYSSSFARARQTAQASLETLLESDVKDSWKINEKVILEDGLIERFFGRLDGTALETYNFVWPVDMLNVTNTEYDVESVAAVATRLRETITDIDAVHSNSHIVLVSHADVLQITQLYGAGAENVGEFSQYRFGNGEVRLMGRTTDTLPKPVPLQLPQEKTQS